MRTIFMGTPEFAVPTLQALVDAAHEVVTAIHMLDGVISLFLSNTLTFTTTTSTTAAGPGPLDLGAAPVLAYNRGHQLLLHRSMNCCEYLRNLINHC